MRLENWYIAEVAGEKHACGEIHDHPNLAPGTFYRTAKIIGQYINRIITPFCTYELGTPFNDLDGK